MTVEWDKIMINEVQRSSDEIDLKELFSALWFGKVFVLAITMMFCISAVFYALSMPDVYKSEVLLAPVSEDSGLKLPGQLGGLASLAGVSLGDKGGDKIGLSLEIMKSRRFLGEFIEKHDLYIPLMAASGWERTTNSLLIDEKVYSESSGKWVRQVDAPLTAKPSNIEAYEEFRKIFSINQDKANGMVKLSIEHYSPIIAKSWLDKIVVAINEDMRNRELIEAERSISYLNSKIENTTISDVRTMLYSLIEEQIKTTMLASVRTEYVFKTVDPAVVSEKKAGPKRAFIVVFAMMVGLMLSCFIVIVRHFNRR